METTESNKLIALFMGEDYRDNHVVRLTGNICKSNPKGELHFPIEYHKSFDWLMPVVEKIESLPEVDEFNIDCQRQFDDTPSLQIIEILPTYNNSFGSIKASGGSKISLLYNVCVQFFQWYNLQPK